MNRFTTAFSVALAAAGLIAATSGLSQAAAPTVSHTRTTQVTNSGKTAITYTGYMNGESFQQDAITSYQGWQYAVFWDSSSRVNIARRQLPAGSWQDVVLTDYKTSSSDSHNVISLGISRADGTLHLAFDMHASVFRYRKSIAGLASNPTGHAWNASAFGAVTSQLTGSTINQATYPQFINAPGGNLQLVMRIGSSGSGDEMLWTYSGGRWSYQGRFIDGISTSVNAYLFGIEYNASGILEMTWTWRETPDGSSNHDLMFAYSKDQGKTWRNNGGTVIATTGTSFIRPSSPGAKVWTIAQNRGLMNQESQVVDHSGVVHVLASQLPANAPSQSNFTTARNTVVLVHYYRSTNGSWHQTYTPFLERSSRADIVADGSDNLYVVSGDSTTHKMHIETASKASGWSDWVIRYTSNPIYFSDPLIDHALITTSNTLSIFAPQSGNGTIDIQDWTVG